MKTVTEITEAMQAIVDAAEAETRSLTDEEVTRYESLEADLKATRKSDEVRSKQSAYAAAAPAVIRATPKGDAALEFAFEQYLRTGHANADIIELRSQSVGTPSEGGYLVPDGFRTKLVDTQKAFGGIASVAETISTASGANLEWPTADDTANVGEIVAEKATIASGDDLVFGTATLGAYKYMSGGASNLGLRISMELLQDSAFDIQAFVAKKLGERIARAQAAHFATGNGSGQPKGLFYSPADIEMATGNALTYALLLDVVHDVDPAYREAGKWVFNDATLKTVRSLVDANDRPLWQPANTAGIQGLPGGLLMGYPVIIDQSAPSVGNSNNQPGEAHIAFGDIAEAYVIRRVRDISIVADPYTRAGYGEVQFWAIARADATIQNRAAYSLMAGYDAP